MRFIVGIVFFLISGCASRNIYSTKGEELYYEKCGGCHRLYSKSELSLERWKVVTDNMSVKAKLSEGEKRILLIYLTDGK